MSPLDETRAPLLDTDSTGAADTPGVVGRVTSAALRRDALGLGACLLVAVVLVFPALGARPLFSAGEVRGALIAHEMVESGDFVQPRLNHVRYYEKPPLMYWAIAAAEAWLGAGEFAARLPAALAFVVTMLVVFLLGHECLGRAGAMPAALIFATTPAAFHFGRFVSLDSVLTLFLTIALYGLVLATRPLRGGTAPASGWGLFWLGAALAGLTKGLIGVLFPLVAAAVYAAVAGRAVVRRLRCGPGLALLAAVLLPWHVLLAWRDPSFVPFYLLNEHVYRFLNTREPIDYDSMSIPAFWVAVGLWSLPWSLFWPAAVRTAIRERQLTVPLVWAAVILGFFTLSQARLEYYGQPAYPALAVLVAGAWLAFDRSARPARSLALAGAVMVVLGLVATYLGLLRPSFTTELTALVSNVDGYYREYFDKHPDRAVFFTRDALGLAPLFAAAWLALGVSALAAARRGRTQVAFAVWIAALLPTTVGFDRGMRLIAADRSQRQAAQLIQTHWDPAAHLVIAGTYEDAAGVTFYTGHRTEILDGDDADLLFGRRAGDAPDLFLTQERFDALWASPARVFLLTNVDRDVPHAILLLDTPRHRLLTNHPFTGPAAPPG